MSQMSFSDFEYAGKRKQTRRERFLAEMERFGGIDRAALPKGRRWSQAVPTGNHAAHSPAAELVLRGAPVEAENQGRALVIQ